MKLKDPTGYGRIITDEQNLDLRIIEQKDASEDERKIQEVFTGILLIDGSLLKSSLNKINNQNAANEYYLTDLVEILSEKGVRINCIQADPDEVLGANNKLELHELESILRRMSAEKLLEKGITLLDASRVDVRGQVEAGKDCSVDVNVIFEGKVTLGENVTIKSNVVLQDVSIGDNSIVESFSHLSSATVGSNCSIGPYARLREGSEIGDNAKIGNFVEIKNAQIGEGAKVNHLSYIGDADIGSDSNIGAGTITCNYDGVMKHHTQIGQNVFIGSNTMLVAPVDMSGGAMTASGAVITKNVPKDALAVARAEQINKPGLARKLRKLLAKRKQQNETGKS